MGAFDSSSDIPNQIKTEGELINVSFAPGKPTSGQGTIEWNIPAPALGCASGTDGAYCGIVFLLSTTPLTIDDVPQNGTFYVADDSADPDIHVGDRRNNALVIGAFYEGEKKARGEELTTEFTIKDLKSNTPYYVAGYAVDCQGRYHRDGQRAYSAEFGNPEEPGTPGTQVVVLGEGNGVQPTDGTGLVPGMTYEFEVVVNSEFPNENGNQVVKVSGDGADFGTYQDLIDEINKSLGLAGNTDQSPVPPDQGRYYWDGEGMFQWDGNIHQPVNTLIESTDPADVAFGDYWYDPNTEQLQRYNIPVPNGWNPVETIKYHEDPTTLSGGGDYWFDGTNAYSWCATTWCGEEITVSNEDPGVPSSASCGDYWYDETNNKLFNWNIDIEGWSEVFAINWDVAPNALNNGDYWFDDTNEELNQWDGSVFNNVPVILSTESFPTTTVNDGDLWYNSETEQLQQWVQATSEWIDIPVLSWPDNPTDTTSCELWWRNTDNKLFKWDIINNEWDEVQNFTISTTDPYGTPTIEFGELWYNPAEYKMYRWDGIRWLEVTFINFPTQPNLPPIGTSWYDTTNDKWYVWNTPNSGWNSIDPIDSENDPLSVPSGTFWFDTTGEALYERIGSTWQAIPFSTQNFYPEHGDTWFDTTNNVLMEWVRDPDDPLGGPGSWQEATPIASAVLNDQGHLRLQTSTSGSNNMILIILPEGVSGASRDCIATGTAGVEVQSVCGGDGKFTNFIVPETTVTADTFLFDNLDPPGQIQGYQNGDDAVNSLPSYQQLGVGTDGSPDERREVMDWVRSQLGYPVVEVELTQKQIDESVDMALATLRQRTALAYERGAFFLDIQPREQHYILKDRTCGFHKVVSVTSAHRFTSAFLSSAHGSGVYGQIVLQHLYNMGTFDLLSYHLVSEYVEQLEHLFATRLVFHWNESDRILSFHQSFAVPERVLLDVTIERTEQSIMKDRWARTWIQRFSLMRGMEILAQVRGKFSTLPGAGGGISLNAADLLSKANELKEELNMEIEDYIADDPESMGMHSTFILG